MLRLSLLVCALSSPLCAQRKSLANITHDVAMKYMQAIRIPANKNVLFSPAALVQLYAMVFAASEGQLKKQLNDQVFGGWFEGEIYDVMTTYTNTLSKVNRASNVKLTLANKIFYQSDYTNVVLPTRDLSTAINHVFNSNLEKADFSTNAEFQRHNINIWLAEQSNGLIQELFQTDDVTRDSIMLLASGAAIDGNFTYGFNNKSTEPRLFFPTSSTANLVQAMTTTCSRFFFSETAEATVVGMPYGIREQLVFFFILPTNAFGLADLERAFAEDLQLLPHLLDNAVDYSKIVSVTLPRFTLQPDSYDSRVALMLMGTTTMFANGFVDFSKINGRKNLFVTGAKHRAFFQAKEGTARVCPKDEDSGLGRVHVNFNQPFLVVALEKSTRTLLLYGRVTSTL